MGEGDIFVEIDLKNRGVGAVLFNPYISPKLAPSRVATGAILML